MIAKAIVYDDFYADNPKKQEFMKKYYVEAWIKQSNRQIRALELMKRRNKGID